MTKNQIKNLPIINFNHQVLFYLDELDYGRHIFKVKKGRKFVYFLEIRKHSLGYYLQRYDYYPELKKYESGKPNCWAFAFNKDKRRFIDWDIINDFDNIEKAISVLSKYNLL